MSSLCKKSCSSLHGSSDHRVLSSAVQPGPQPPRSPQGQVSGCCCHFLSTKGERLGRTFEDGRTGRWQQGTEGQRVRTALRGERQRDVTRGLCCGGKGLGPFCCRQQKTDASSKGADLGADGNVQGTGSVFWRDADERMLGERESRQQQHLTDLLEVPTRVCSSPPDPAAPGGGREAEKGREWGWGWKQE